MWREEATVFAKQIHPLRRLFIGAVPRLMGGVLCGGDSGVMAIFRWWIWQLGWCDVSQLVRSGGDDGGVMWW